MTLPSPRHPLCTDDSRGDAQHRQAACDVQRPAAREEPGEVELVDPCSHEKRSPKYGGFPSHGGTIKNGWLRENAIYKMDD